MTTTIQEHASSIPAGSTKVDKKPRRPITLGTVMAFGLLFTFLGLLAWGLIQSRRGPVDSGLSPDFTLTGFDDQTVTLSKLRGQVVVINFWASWCQPCRQEAAYLERTWRKYKDQGVVFIGVDYVDTESAALAYINELLNEP